MRRLQGGRATVERTAGGIRRGRFRHTVERLPLTLAGTVAALPDACRNWRTADRRRGAFAAFDGCAAFDVAGRLALIADRRGAVAAFDGGKM